LTGFWFSRSFARGCFFAFFCGWRSARFSGYENFEKLVANIPHGKRQMRRGMMQEEFKKLAGVRESVSSHIYAEVEDYYMSGKEDKQTFVKRIFGGINNTPRSIVRKMAEEACRINREALKYNAAATAEKLDKMDRSILAYYSQLARMDVVRKGGAA
jgi:hypothetical protein